MIELAAQVLQNYDLRPMQMDAEKVKAYKPNQIVTIKVKGAKKPRSVLQLNTYWACCNTTAENTENVQWNTKEKVDFQCRVGLHFVNPDLVVVKPDGTVQFQYRSIAFKNLGHMAACNYFDRALEYQAKFLGCTVDQLVAMAKEGMKG